MASTIAHWLEGVWYRDRIGAALLAPLASLFAAGTALRRALFRSGLRRVYRAHVPVVVIGNLSVGGTGKSPLVATLALMLQRRDLRPAILTRGYGTTIEAPTLVTPQSDPSLIGDEPLMLFLATRVPVMVSPDRAAGARALEMQGGIDLILCDDGLQHYALARDLEVVVIDAARGLGNGRLLPAGPLREAPSRLESVDWVVIHDTGSTTAETPWRGRSGTLHMQLVPEAPRGIADPRQWRSIEGFRNSPVHAVAGIGHPARFFEMLRAAGLEVIEHPFADHYVFTAADFVFGDDRPILMTAKDAVKCRPFADARFWEVPAVVRLAPDAARHLAEALEKLVEARPITQG